MVTPDIRVIPEADYVASVTTEVAEKINEIVEGQGSCRVMLTGGRTAEKLYRYWAEQSPWDHRKVGYYFGDERCVRPDDPESNFGMAMTALFPNGVPDGSVVERMRGETKDRNQEAARYAEQLPEQIDVLLLSVGPDGHIASIFPESDVVNEKETKVQVVTGDKFPYERFTVTPRVISAAKALYLFAAGAEKGAVLRDALNSHEDYVQFPLLLAKRGIWLVDDQAATALNSQEGSA